MSDTLQFLLVINLALGAGILLVLALRRPVRTIFGPRMAYALWLLPALAAVASVLPPRIVEIIVQAAPMPPAPEFIGAPAEAIAFAAPIIQASQAFALDPWLIAGVLWMIGIVAMVLWLGRSQLRFMKDVRLGHAGPAVVGFRRPRIVTPADFAVRFEPREQDVILAHETIHLRRQDPRINALVAALRCVCWFNPLVHLGAHCMRIDQELACDAAVVARHPNARRSYADALLKAQMASRPLPLGCYWPAISEHPLTERVAMLKQVAPGRVRRIAGAGLLTCLLAGVGVAAWAAQPAATRIVEIEAPVDVTPVVDDTPDNTPETPTPSPDDAPQPPLGDDRFIEVPQPAPGFIFVPSTEPTPPRIDSTLEITADAVTRNDVTGETVYEGNVVIRGPFGVILRTDRVVVGRDGATTPGTGQGVPARTIQRTGADPARTFPMQLPPSEMVTLTGTIRKIELGSQTSAVWVEVSEAHNNGKPLPLGDTPPTWRILAEAEPNAPKWARDPATIGMRVVVEASASITQNCTDDCTLLGKLIRQANGRPMPGITFGPGFWLRPGPPLPPLPAAAAVPQPTAEEQIRERLGLLVGEKPGPAFPSLFDANAPVLLDGVITKMELGDPNSFMWVTANGKSYKVWLSRVRLLPMALKDPAIVGVAVKVRGYLGKDKSCNPDCIVNGRDVTLADGRALTQPTSATPAVMASYYPFEAYFDGDAPLILRGRIESVDYQEPYTIVWLKASTSTPPSGSPGDAVSAEPRFIPESRLWRVEIAPPAKIPDSYRARLAPGASVEVRGWNARDTSCQPTCLMHARPTDSNFRQLTY